MSRRLVSVLIPTFNYARYLPEALDSVLSQDMEDYEVLVADDASSDATEEVMREYTAKDSRITFVRHPSNLGMVENWNWCLEHAKGKYIKYLLADDTLRSPDALRKLSDALECDNSLALAASSRAIIDENSNEVSLVRPLGNKNRTISADRMIKRYLNQDAKHMNPVGEPTAVMFRRAYGSRGFDLSYRQLVDAEMWFHLLQQGGLAYLAEPLCCFRRHPDQQTAVNKRQFLHQQEEIALCRRYSDPAALKRVLFHKMYRISKLKEPALSELIESVRAEYNAVEYAACFVEYKLTRPFINVKRSLKKRLSGDEFVG